jgi:hypothetical protein
MAMTIRPDASGRAVEPLPSEALYAFRCDLDGDAREEVTFKLRFTEVDHADAAGHVHRQRFSVRRAIGDDARQGDGGELLLDGELRLGSFRSLALVEPVA